MTTTTARLEAFSDGVFAIAITLLILEIKVPEFDVANLGQELWAHWPSYLSFLISFVFIGIMWINHHRVFTHIRKSDDVLMLLNLLLMLGVCVVPFTTALVAAHLGHPGQRVAVVVYDATYFMIALFYNLLWRYAVAHDGRLLDPEFSLEHAAMMTRRYNYGPLAYAVAIGLAWVNIEASLLINLVLACFFAMPLHWTVARESKPNPGYPSR